jgi:hypothetical protein
MESDAFPFISLEALHIARFLKSGLNVQLSKQGRLMKHGARLRNGRRMHKTSNFEAGPPPTRLRCDSRAEGARYRLARDFTNTQSEQPNQWVTEHRA